MYNVFNKILILVMNKLSQKNYFLILLLTLFFLCLFVFSMNTIKKEIILLTEENQERIINETKSKVFNWVNFSKKILEGSATFISKGDFFNDEKNILLYLNEIKDNFDDFDIVQLMLEDGRIFNNNNYIHTVKDIQSAKMELVWYKDVAQQLKTTINTLNKHAILGEKTMNICSPVIKNQNLHGVLCGVIKESTIIEKVRKLSLPENIYFFIVTENEKIIINSEASNELKEQIKKIISNKKNINSAGILKCEFGGYLMTISSLEVFNWNVGVGINKADAIKSAGVLFWQSIAILVGFFILVIVANATHEFFYNRLNRKFRRVQALIEIWIKDGDKGFVIVESNDEITFCNAKATEYINAINNHNKKTHYKIEQILKERKNTKNIIKTDSNFFEIYTYSLYLKEQYEGTIILIKDITKDIELKQAKKEHEYIFMHQEKMIEIGELIVGINHQLKQPINGLSILMSNLLQQYKNNSLNDKTFTTNIMLCQKNLAIMNDIIDLYRKYYKNSFEIVEFSIKDCVNSIKDILDTKIKRNNIQLTINIDEKLEAYTRENVIQQIVLVLLQNAIDENIESNNKNITISAAEENTKIVIKVADFGRGLSEKVVAKLFKNPVETMKKNGTGFGLYFANKLADKKLNGYIKVENYKNPTVFVLEFEKNYSENTQDS